MCGTNVEWWKKQPADVRLTKKFEPLAKRFEKRVRCEGQHGTVATAVAISVDLFVIGQSEGLMDPVDLFFSMAIVSGYPAGEPLLFCIQAGSDQEEVVSGCPAGDPVFGRGGNHCDDKAGLLQPGDLSEGFGA